MSGPAQQSSLTWIGTATSLIRLGPFTILTDPNFLHRGEVAWLGWGLMSRRLTDPAIAIDALPPLDAVVLSHLHGDHWDRRARAGLPKYLPILTTTHGAPRLQRQGFPNAVGLRTWQQHRLEKAGCTLTVTSLPGLHSTNNVLRKLLPPVMGSLLELEERPGRPVARIYISGDTMVFDGLTEIGRRHPDIDTAVLHVGRTTLPGGAVVTMGGEHAAECLRRVTPRVAVPIHHGDYGVFRESLEQFRAVVEPLDLPVEMRYVERGGTIPLC